MWNNQTVRVQDKGSGYVIFDNNNWILKWHSLKVMNIKWKSYIIPHNSRPGKMYGNIKTHKTDNPARVITSGSNTTVERLSIFVEKELYGIASDLLSKVKDTSQMLDTIGDLDRWS